MWVFDLEANRWQEIFPWSVFTHGARSNAFMTVVEDQKKIVLFGGDVSSRPNSDLWVFVIEMSLKYSHSENW